MSARDIFLFVGRTLPFLYLSFFFIISIVEHVERDQTSTAVNPQAAVSFNIVRKSISDLRAPYITNIALVEKTAACPTGFSAQQLAEWEAVDHCVCLSSVNPGPCNLEQGACREEKNVRKTVNVWEGRKLCVATQATVHNAILDEADKPICAEGRHLCRNSNVCVNRVANEVPACPITALSIQIRNAADLQPSPLKGFFKVGDFRNTSGLALYASREVGNAPINKIGVSFGSIPCVDPSLDAQSGFAKPFPILKRPVVPGCGKYGQSSALSIPIATKDESELWIDNDQGLYFAELPGYANYISGQKSYLYSHSKPVLKQDDECLEIAGLDSRASFESDNSGTYWKRNFVNIFTYVTVGIALLLFTFYFCLKSRASIGLSYCVFWFIHLICIALAITQIVIAALCLSELNHFNQRNQYLKEYSDLSCFNEPSLNRAWGDVYRYASVGQNRLYLWCHISLWVSVAFLIIEFIYIIWYGIAYKCRSKIDEDEIELISNKNNLSSNNNNRYPGSSYGN